jgi:hypothetical protein
MVCQITSSFSSFRGEHDEKLKIISSADINVTKSFFIPSTVPLTTLSFREAIMFNQTAVKLIYHIQLKSYVKI